MELPRSHPGKPRLGLTLLETVLATALVAVTAGAVVASLRNALTNAANAETHAQRFDQRLAEHARLELLLDAMLDAAQDGSAPHADEPDNDDTSATANAPALRTLTSLIRGEHTTARLQITNPNDNSSTALLDVTSLHQTRRQEPARATQTTTTTDPNDALRHRVWLRFRAVGGRLDGFDLLRCVVPRADHDDHDDQDDQDDPR